MDIQSSLSWAKENLQGISQTASLDSEVLLAYLLRQTKEYLLTHPEKRLNKKFIQDYRNLVSRRAKGEPVAYLINHQEFFGLDFYVDHRVLIPRPETEALVEDVLEICSKNPQIKHIVDLGTGSGCIAIVLAKNLSQSQVWALEISEDALRIADINVKKHQLEDRIDLIQSNLLVNYPEELQKEKPIIIANLPYIGTSESNFIAQETEKYEPHLALFGGKDGLFYYEKLLQQIRERKILFHSMFFEIGFSQEEKIQKLIKKHLPQSKVTVKKDLADLPRTVEIALL